jgi:hypothetical protein
MKHCFTIVQQYEAFAVANMKHKRLKPLALRNGSPALSGSLQKNSEKNKSYRS